MKSFSKAQRAPAAFALLFLFSGCVNVPPPRPAPAAAVDPATLMPALEGRIYQLVNTERHKLHPKAPMLTLDSELVAVAREKSADMAIRNYAAHRGPDGRTTADIVMQKDAQFEGVLGEDIAEQPFVPGYSIDVEAIANRVVETWLASTPHREILVDPSYDRTGIGAAVHSNTIYVTELFAARLPDTMPSPPPR